MITEIRDYFTGIIRTVDPDLRFDGFAFGTEQFGHTAMDRTYKLVIGATTQERLDTSYLAGVPVEVIIYRSSGYDVVEDFDDMYCKSIEIAARSEDQTTISQAGFIKSVISGIIVPESIEDNDNAMRFRIQFSVSAYFAIE